MRRPVRLLAAAVLALCGARAVAYGQEGHAIVAEIAQRRLDAAAAAEVERLLGRRVSLASVASWADDVRDTRPDTYDWHFVNIPLQATDYVPARDCKPDPARGDCIVAALARIEAQLRCSPDDALRREALKFAVHLVGDLHQPLHTVLDALGGNQVRLRGPLAGPTCHGKCALDPAFDNLHALWDTTLIRRITHDWGAYVDRLESGWLATDGARARLDDDTPLDWALQSHALAPLVWNDRLVHADGSLDERYGEQVSPVLDQELALGGVRLARFLNGALSTRACGAPAAARPSGDANDADAVGEAATAWILRRAGDMNAARPAGDLAARRAALVLNVDVAGHAPALKLFRAARAAGVAVFLVTGRPDTPGERAATTRALHDRGFDGWTELVMRPAGVPQPGASPADFEAPARARLAMAGYAVLANVGGRASDLSGGFAEKSFLMPDAAP